MVLVAVPVSTAVDELWTVVETPVDEVGADSFVSMKTTPDVTGYIPVALVEPGDASGKAVYTDLNPRVENSAGSGPHRKPPAPCAGIHRAPAPQQYPLPQSMSLDDGHARLDSCEMWRLGSPCESAPKPRAAGKAV